MKTAAIKETQELKARSGTVPHQTHHGLDVRNQSLVSAEYLCSWILAEGEPGPVFLNQLLTSARIEHLLEVPATENNNFCVLLNCSAPDL